jgi:hypothetical protein
VNRQFGSRTYVVSIATHVLQHCCRCRVAIDGVVVYIFELYRLFLRIAADVFNSKKKRKSQSRFPNEKGTKRCFANTLDIAGGIHGRATYVGRFLVCLHGPITADCSAPSRNFVGKFRLALIALQRIRILSSERLSRVSLNVP